MKKVGVSILGLGTVGSGVYRVLTEHREFFQRTQDIDLVVESVFEADEGKIAALGVPAEKVAHNIAEVVLDPDVNIVAECIGGVTCAREYVLDALGAGKTVVTSNKELICKCSQELERAAKRNNAGVFFEASCVGGIPIVRTLLDGLQSNEISGIMGIINGTANFILTEMTEKQIPYAEALAHAQALGYAHSDPVGDVEGYDAAYQLSILSSLAFHLKVPYTKVFREGITNISVEDIEDGRSLGYVLKLLAVGKVSPAGIEMRVHPAFVRKDHPLASVQGGDSAVFVTGDSLGDLMLYGHGAGSLSMGSAVASDIIYASTHGEVRYSPLFRSAARPGKDIKFLSDFKSAYYLRLTAADEPGVLAKLSNILAKYNISIVELAQRAAEQEGKATLVLVTHETHEQAVKNAVAKLNGSGLAHVESVLRVAL